MMYENQIKVSSIYDDKAGVVLARKDAVYLGRGGKGVPESPLANRSADGTAEGFRLELWDALRLANHDPESKKKFEHMRAEFYRIAELVRKGETVDLVCFCVHKLKADTHRYDNDPTHTVCHSQVTRKALLWYLNR